MKNQKQAAFAALDGYGGSTTALVASKVPPLPDHDSRKHSAHVRKLLLELEAEGKAKKMDDQKPVCWMRS